MSGARWTFYYDGECGMCAGFVRRARRLDLRERISWIPFDSPDWPPQYLTGDDLERSAWLVSDAGEVHEGFHAIRKLFRQIPALMPLGLLLHIPGIHVVGVPLYRRVARNRYCISIRASACSHRQ